jgi:hypothetical protein
MRWGEEHRHRADPTTTAKAKDHFFFGVSASAASAKRFRDWAIERSSRRRRKRLKALAFDGARE